MFRIAICDDEKIFRDDLKEILIRYMTDRGIMLEIYTFSSGKEFVELGIEMVKYKIVFLDINMDELDGIMTAKKIRENSKDMFIVFVTAFVNYTIEGYKVDAVRYILKDNKNLVASVYECMDAIHEKMDYKITWAEFDFCEGTRKVSLNRILYIESKLHKLEFHVMEDCLQKYTLQGTLNEIDDKFAGNDFLRIHQSFLVNMKFIKDVSRYRVLLESFVNKISGQISKELDFICTNNVIVDAVLNTKYQEIRDKGIVFVFKINDLSSLNISDEDVVVIMSNLLNNAIEACEKCRGDKIIKLKIVIEDNNAIISVKNTYENAVIYENGEIQTTKILDTDEHGIGIKNIAETIRKYGGSYVIQNDEREFYFSIMIPLVKSDF